MIKISMVTKGTCCECDKKASKEIDGKLYCPSCGDTLLMVTMKKCIQGIEDAVVKISIMPKRKGN